MKNGTRLSAVFKRFSFLVCANFVECIQNFPQKSAHKGDEKKIVC